MKIQRMSNSSSININSTLEEVYSAVGNILKELKPLKLDESVIFDIRLCVEEALINAVKHGNCNKNHLPITINYSISEDKIKISIQDQGCGFNYESLPNPTVKKNLLKGRGRGIYLIRDIMDKVVFNDAGNRITMIKNLDLKKGE